MTVETTDAVGNELDPHALVADLGDVDDLARPVLVDARDAPIFAASLARELAQDSGASDREPLRRLLAALHGTSYDELCGTHTSSKRSTDPATAAQHQAVAGGPPAHDVHAGRGTAGWTLRGSPWYSNACSVAAVMLDLVGSGGMTPGHGALTLAERSALSRVDVELADREPPAPAAAPGRGAHDRQRGARRAPRTPAGHRYRVGAAGDRLSAANATCDVILTYGSTVTTTHPQNAGTVNYCSNISANTPISIAINGGSSRVATSPCSGATARPSGTSTVTEVGQP